MATSTNGTATSYIERVREPRWLNSQDAEVGSYAVKSGLAQMLKGGVIMDVVNAEQAKIAEDDPTPTIDKIRTLWAALPKDQERKLEVIAEIKEMSDGEGAKLIKGEQKERLEPGHGQPRVGLEQLAPRQLLLGLLL